VALRSTRALQVGSDGAISPSTSGCCDDGDGHEDVDRSHAGWQNDDCQRDDHGDADAADDDLWLQQGTLPTKASQQTPSLIQLINPLLCSQDSIVLIGEVLVVATPCSNML